MKEITVLVLFTDQTDKSAQLYCMNRFQIYTTQCMLAGRCNISNLYKVFVKGFPGECLLHCSPYPCTTDSMVKTQSQI